LFPIGFITSIAAVIVIFGELIYLRRFALRGLNLNLARSTQNIMWCFVLVTGLAAVSAIAVAMLSNGAEFSAAASEFNVSYSRTLDATQPGSIAFAASLCVFGLVFLWLFIWYIALLRRFQIFLSIVIASAKRPVNSRSVPV